MFKAINLSVVATLVAFAWTAFDADPASARKCHRDKAFSTAYYCASTKSYARNLAKKQWRIGIRNRHGGKLTKWGWAKRKRIQCRRVSRLKIGSPPKRPGCRNQNLPGPSRPNRDQVWSCRAMAIPCG